MGVLTPPIWKTLTCLTLPSIVLTSFCRLDELGLEAVGQRVDPDRAVLACRVVEPGRWCRRCGCEGAPRDTVTRRLAHEPLGWRPTVLLVTIRRYRCAGCGHVWRQDTSKAAWPRAKLSRRGLRWALEGIVCQHLSIARVAEGLGVVEHRQRRGPGRGQAGTDRGSAPVRRREGHRRRRARLEAHPPRRQVRHRDHRPTPIRAGSGPARWLDMVEGRSKQVFKQWLSQREQSWRDGVEVVAMDGFTGFKTATAEELPDAVAVMDPFHVVRPVSHPRWVMPLTVCLATLSLPESRHHSQVPGDRSGAKEKECLLPLRRLIRS